MRQRPVGSRGDDRRERRLCSQLADPRLAGACDLPLGAPGQRPLDGPAVDLVGQVRRGRDPLQLLGLLDGADLLHEVAGGNQLEVFDTASWGTRWRSHAHDGGVFHLDVSPSGRSIVTTGPDGFVRLWSAEDGSLLHAISLGDDYGKAVAFTDDRHVVVGTQEGLVTGLTFDVDELLEIGMSRVTRTLTEQECRTDLQSTQCP